MRLLKLLVLGLIGYAAYEFFRGMSGEASPAQRADGERNRIGRSPTRAVPTGQAMATAPMPTGGMEVTTGDASGGAVRHRVGRGVIAR